LIKKIGGHNKMVIAATFCKIRDSRSGHNFYEPSIFAKQIGHNYYIRFKI